MDPIREWRYIERNSNLESCEDCRKSELLNGGKQNGSATTTRAKTFST
jgi:hypothetical protein